MCTPKVYKSAMHLIILKLRRNAGRSFPHRWKILRMWTLRERYAEDGKVNDVEGERQRRR